MKVFAISKLLPAATPAAVKELSLQEAAQAWNLYKSDRVREVFFRKDKPGVIITLEVASTEEAGKVLSVLPFVNQGLIEFDLIPVGPFLNYEMLFDPSKLAQKE